MGKCAVQLLAYKMICRYENIEQKLSEKCDVGEMTKLESRIKQLEDKTVLS